LRAAGDGGRRAVENDGEPTAGNTGATDRTCPRAAGPARYARLDEDFRPAGRVRRANAIASPAGTKKAIRGRTADDIGLDDQRIVATRAGDDNAVTAISPDRVARSCRAARYRAF